MNDDEREKTAVGALYYAIDKMSAGGKALSAGGRALVKGVSKIYSDVHPLISAMVEAKSNKIVAQNEIETQKLYKESGMRMLAKAVRADQNVEQIVTLAAQSIPEDVPEESINDIDEDWMASWMEYAGRISEEQMQSIWAGVLAGKAQSNKSREFSLKTLAILRDMDSNVAQQFTNFCQFVTDPVGNFGEITSLITKIADDVYKKQGINHNLLHEFSSIGLITIWPHLFSKELDHSGQPTLNFLSYRGHHVVLQLKLHETYGIPAMEMGEVSLTHSGKDLFSIIRKTHDIKNEEFWAYMINHWKEAGLNPREISTEEVNMHLEARGFPPLGKTP